MVTVQVVLSYVKPSTHSALHALQTRSDVVVQALPSDVTPATHTLQVEQDKSVHRVQSLTLYVSPAKHSLRQLLHVEAPSDAPVDDDHVPAAHRVHVVAPIDDEYAPDQHWRHVEAPLDVE